jgi:signal transduction histidine kinase
MGGVGLASFLPRLGAGDRVQRKPRLEQQSAHGTSRPGGLSARGLEVTLPSAVGRRTWAYSRLVTANGSQDRGRRIYAAAVCVVGLTVLTAVIGLNSRIVDHPAVFVTLRAIGCIGVVAVALALSVRSSNNRRMPAALITAAGLLALSGLTNADSPWPFAIGRIAIPLSILGILYVSFAYPSGWIEDRTLSRLFEASAVVMAVLLAANLLLSDVSPVAGPFVRCSGRACPANPLNLVTLGNGASQALSTALALATGVALLGAAVLVARRLVNGTPLQRSGLSPLLVWALLAALGYGFFIILRGIDDGSGALTSAAVVVAVIIALLPFALALGINRGRVFAMEALERIMADLRKSSSLPALQRTISEAFADPQLVLLLWRRDSEDYVGLAGEPVDASEIECSRTLTQVRRDGETLAAVVHDPVLTDDVVDAVGAVVLMALDNARLQTDLSASITELEASRNRVAWAADRERRRIEQDLHDGAQQGLIALRVKLDLLHEVAGEDPGAIARGLADAGRRVDTALESIRSLAHGIYPAVLRDLGLSYALGSIARELPIEIAVHGTLTDRYPAEIETALYFCCAEALQNVAKHCGAEARADLWVSQRESRLQFVLIDDGPGFDPGLLRATHGIVGMRDRLAAVGGQLAIDSAPGRGTRIKGFVPTGLGG